MKFLLSIFALLLLVSAMNGQRQLPTLRELLSKKHQTPKGEVLYGRVFRDTCDEVNTFVQVFIKRSWDYVDLRIVGDTGTYSTGWKKGTATLRGDTLLCRPAIAGSDSLIILNGWRAPEIYFEFSEGQPTEAIFYNEKGWWFSWMPSSFNYIIWRKTKDGAKARLHDDGPWTVAKKFYFEGPTTITDELGYCNGIFPYNTKGKVMTAKVRRY